MKPQKVSEQPKGKKDPVWWNEEHETLYQNLSSTEGKEAATQWKSALVKGAALTSEAKLREVFRLINSPLPENEEDLDKVPEAWVRLYTNFSPLKIDYPVVSGGEIIGFVRSPLAPPAPTHELPTWIPTLWQETRKFIEAFYDNLVNNGRGLALPAVHHAQGVRYSLVKDGQVVHLYATEDATSAFLLTLGDLLSEVKDLTRIRRCRCGKFFLRKGKQAYCCLKCTRKAHPSKDRVRKTREHRLKWEKTKEALRQILTDMHAIERKQKPKRPRSERQLLAEAEEALKITEAVFTKAYPRKKGQEYGEEKKWLAQASRQVKQLRKKVRGY